MRETYDDNRDDGREGEDYDTDAMNHDKEYTETPN